MSQNNRFNDKPIWELNGYTFHIPSYQRGYRWERDQVNELLNDLREFIDSKPGDEQGYWLQPVVVKSLSEDKHYELIDGQQRLTTLFLLTNFLFNHNPKDSYFFKFDKREIQESFLRNKTFADATDVSYRSNIDTYYMRLAYNEIKRWFELREEENEFEYQAKFKMLLTKGNNQRPSIKIIWFVLDNNEIDAFERLNHGRIRLTGTELVKARLLASKNESSKKEAITRANAWDRMEKSLQEPLFGAMLYDSSFQSLSHIEVILNVVADDLNKDKDYKRDRAKDGEMFNYFIIEKYLHDEGTPASIWKMMEDTFNRMRNWYVNREWYHYIALGRRLAANEFTVPALRKLENKAGTKEQFTSDLRKIIGKIIGYDFRVPEEKNKGKHPLEADGLNYNDTPAQIRNILFAVNVIVTLNETLDRFPFNLFDAQNITSLEHIHPQNIAEMTDHLSPGDIKEWVYDRLKKIGNGNFSSDEINLLDEYFSDDNSGMQKKHIDVNSQDWLKVRPIIDKIDEAFGDMAQIDAKDLHSISNMALVTQEANSALSNNYLSEKRRILLNRKKTLREYLMPLTDRVFSKYYSVDAGIDAGDMRLWRKEDRTAYLNALKDVYDDFTRHPDSDNSIENDKQ